MILFEVSSIAKKAAIGGLVGGALGAGAYALGKAGTLYTKFKQEEEIAEEPFPKNLFKLIKFLADNPEYADFVSKNLKYTASDNIEDIKDALEKAAEKMGDKTEEAKQAVKTLISLINDKTENAKEKLESVLEKLKSTEETNNTEVMKNILRYILKDKSEDIATMGIAGAGLGATAGATAGTAYMLAKKLKSKR